MSTAASTPWMPRTGWFRPYRSRTARSSRWKRRRPARSGTKVVDLRGRTVVPGIIDNHNHIVLMGNRPGYHTPLENALFGRGRAGRPIGARGAALPRRDAWITTIGGFHFNHLYEPRKLAAVPDARRARQRRAEQPGVHDRSAFTGPGVTNSAGKAFCRRKVRGTDGHDAYRGRRRDWQLRRAGGRPKAIAVSAPDAAQPDRAPAERHRRDELRPQRRRDHAPRPGRVPGDQHPGRRRGARGQLHDAHPVPRDLRRRGSARSGCASTSCTWRPIRTCRSSGSG